jgi:hypothetical protein
MNDVQLTALMAAILRSAPSDRNGQWALTMDDAVRDAKEIIVLSVKAWAVPR